MNSRQTEQKQQVKQEQQLVAPRESKQTKQRLVEVVYRKRSRNSRKTNPPALAAKLGKSVYTCVYLYKVSRSRGKNPNGRLR